MGRHPDDLLSYLSSSASALTSSERQILLKDVIDRRVSPPVSKAAKDMVSAMKIAIACLNGNPQLRPTMWQVTQDLCRQS
ncbi:hypothetical protein V6N13_102800 [Hibiscus sabdariffa]